MSAIQIVQAIDALLEILNGQTIASATSPEPIASAQEDNDHKELKFSDIAMKTINIYKAVARGNELNMDVFKLHPWVIHNGTVTHIEEMKWLLRKQENVVNQDACIDIKDEVSKESDEVKRVVHKISETITHCRFEHDFDKNGVFYAIGTDLCAQSYANPAHSGLDIVSSGMEKGASYSFIGRDDVTAYTKNEQGSFFYVDLNKYKVKPSAYTLKNVQKSNYHLKSWNLEASNDGHAWTCLKKHVLDESLQGRYKSRTWALNDTNKFYSLFRIVMTGTNGNDTWNLCCSGMELYGDLVESESKRQALRVLRKSGVQQNELKGLKVKRRLMKNDDEYDSEN